MASDPDSPPPASRGGAPIPARLSYLRERTVRVGGREPGGGRQPGADRPIHLGMDRPSLSPDGWWTTLAWARDEHGIVSCLDIAPRAGPPPDPPLMRMGPVFAGALAGFVAEMGGRQALRLRLPEPADPARPWDRPLILQIALTWDPVRAATMSANALAAEALGAFERAVEAAGRAG
jgi:hypothetical protein